MNSRGKTSREPKHSCRMLTYFPVAMLPRSTTSHKSGNATQQVLIDRLIEGLK
jgi:hypothetical protein